MRAAGLNPLPANTRQKCPKGIKWGDYRDNPATADQLAALFASGQNDGLCILTGCATRVECMDFDDARTLAAYKSRLKASDPALFARLVAERTQSGGVHLYYRIKEPVPGNVKLAHKVCPVPGPGRYVLDKATGGPVLAEGKVPHSSEAKQGTAGWTVEFVTIETRGTGGLVLCAPSPGYRVINGDLAAIPTITAEERGLLLALAREFDESGEGQAPAGPNAPEAPAAPAPTKAEPWQDNPLDQRPGTIFNRNCTPGELVSMLIRAGKWTLAGEDKEHFLLTREGKAVADGISGTVRKDAPVFHNFTSNAPPFEPGESYSPFAVKTLLKNGGDFRAAALDVAGGAAPKPATARPFKLLALAEALAEPKLTDWLVYGIIEAACLTVLFGPSEGMKTFMGLDWGLSAASGRAWHGYPVPRPGPVVYVAGEGFRGLAKRVQAWLVEHGLTGAAIPFYLASEPVEFLDPVSVERATAAFAEMAEEHGNPRLIIIDTLARCFGPGNENATEDMGRFVAALDKLRSQFGCAVLVIHHSGLQEKERARGASALRAALDWEYRLDVREDARVLVCTKSKDHERPLDLAFLPVPVPTGWTDPETGAAITSLVLRRTAAPGRKAKPLTGAKRIAMEALASCCEAEGRAHIEDWRAEAYRRGVSPTEEASAKRKAFSRAVSGLLESGHVETEEDFYWPAGQRDTPGQSGTCPAHVPHVPGQSGTGVYNTPSLSRLGTRPAGGDGEEA